MEASDLRGIRTDRWKMIHYRNRPYGELYDLEHDPWETNNLWDDSSLVTVKAHLYSLLINEWIRLGEKSHMRWNVNDPEI
jgi:arylsulfatase A-like enzyme